MSLLEKIRVTQAFLESKGIEKPEFGLILGSGLGELAEEVEDAVVIDYADIPNWGQSTVVGHAGKLVYGTLSGRKVLALQGRFHFYEGNPLEVVTFPVRVMKALGCTPYVEPDVRARNYIVGDILIMCSDGLTNMVKEEEIYKTVIEDAVEAPKKLIEQANKLGGYDNITVITIL